MTYGAALDPLSFPSLALLLGRKIIIQWPQSTPVPLNGCSLSMLHCRGASATWPNCNRLQSALGRGPRLCISAFLPCSLSPLQADLLLHDGRRLASITGARQGLDVAERERVRCRAYCCRITVRARAQIRVLCRRTQHNEHPLLRVLQKIVTATCDAACFSAIRWELGLMIVINAADVDEIHERLPAQPGLHLNYTF